MPIEVLYILVFLIILVAVLGLIFLPKMFHLKESILEVKEELEEGLKRRWASVPKLIELMKPHFRDNPVILEKLIKLRNTTFDNMDFRKKVSTDASIGFVVDELFKVLGERTEKGNAELLNIKKVLEELDLEIGRYKKKYNLLASELNASVKSFPKNIYASLANIEEEELL